MFIYISADIEGISGVVDRSHTMQSGLNYQRARKLMTDEVNAAVKGAKLAGATKIVVNDSHGCMNNILIEDLDEDVILVTGNKKLLGMMEGIDETADAAMFIGYHARHNSPGVLAHSYNSRAVTEIKINGQVVGEPQFNMLVAGYFNVPVALVSGDNVLAEQVKDFNQNVETVIVKEARTRYTAQCIQPKKVHKMLEHTVKETLTTKLGQIKTNKVEGQVELEMSFMDSGMAEATLFIPGVEMIAPNTVKYMAKDIIEASKVRAALTTLASTTI